MLNIKVCWKRHLLVFNVSYSLQLLLQRRYSFSADPPSSDRCVFNARPTYTFLRGVFILLGVTLFFLVFNYAIVDEALDFILLQ